MAHVARLGRWYVCRAFANGYAAVVTVFACVRGMAMIEWHHKGLPTGAGGVTGFAGIRGLGMTNGFIGGICAGVTRGAGIGGLVVSKRLNQWYPYIRGMA